MVLEPVLWVREDHTKAKHELLRAFFNKWVSIHSEHFTARDRGLVRVYDGFAGPGVYAGGEPGSPRITLDALLDNPNLPGRWSPVRYEFTFVEQHARRAGKLRLILEEVEAMARSDGRWTDRVTWSVTCGRYEEHVPREAPGLSAMFLFLDPFGYSHAPMTLTRELVQQPKSDTLIFLPLSFVHRFADREGQDAALDRFFGTRRWRDIPNGTGRPTALLALFREQLVAAGLRWTGAFRLSRQRAATSTGSSAPLGTRRVTRASKRASGPWTRGMARGSSHRGPRRPASRPSASRSLSRALTPGRSYRRSASISGASRSRSSRR